ncbi:MAG: ThiF family adenylyltransferase [Candidatus Nitrotoga sp.]|nr:ThiF family adenylyltransferase [Candidatus Nitrotoga sp.]MDO9448083.1 ThiF family adenylyltransferase [Candidatus Nitrotoga sp.]
MTVSSIAEPTTVDKYFAAVEQACLARGIAVVRLQCQHKDRLGVSVRGKQTSWELDVYCESDSLTRLPSIELRTPNRLLAHVGYRGTVCVSDNQGLSLDPERHEEIAAFTVLAAFDVLEKWSADGTANSIEFYNELEGYWLGLPDSVRARSTVEVNGRDRLIRAFIKTGKKETKWYFTERDSKALLSFETKGLEAQRALYMNLPEPIPPPLAPNRLGPEFLEAARQRMSPDQTELWEQLVGPSRNGPKTLALMLSVPRAAGGRSLIGVSFIAKNGAVDTKAPITPLTVRRYTPTYMRERGGASLCLLGKHIVVLGCGAIGAVVTDALAATGVGSLTLVDGDVYSEDNVFRHIIDPSLVELHKVVGLKFELERRYPGVKIQAVAEWAQEWLKTANFSNVDGIVFAFGLPTLERSFASAIRKRAGRRLPMVFTWLEPLDLGGHSVVLFTEGPGCLDCLYRDDEGAVSLAARTAFLEPNQAVSKNLTGCSSVFVPYGAIQARRTGLMAAEHLLSSMNDSGPTYRYWIGDGTVASEQGLRTTSWWEEAKRVTLSEASQRVFGRPCKRCREAK